MHSMRRSLGIHLYPTPCGIRCYCSTSWRSDSGYVAAGKGYKSCSTTSVSRISQRLSWKASQGGMPWPDCIVPCHIAGMGHYLTGRENSFLQSLDWQDFRMKDFIYIAFAVCPEFHVILCKINESLHYSIIQSSGWTSFI